jgi:hypothetical protein
MWPEETGDGSEWLDGELLDCGWSLAGFPWLEKRRQHFNQLACDQQQAALKCSATDSENQVYHTGQY